LNEHPFQQVLGRDFEVGREIGGKLDGVKHGVASRPGPDAPVRAVC
jgi:hypothetical protein